MALHLLGKDLFGSGIVETDLVELELFLVVHVIAFKVDLAQSLDVVGLLLCQLLGVPAVTR